ncbi:MAG TPA: hypothetical protein VGM26_14800 [Rhizomicrobium sp.]
MRYPRMGQSTTARDLRNLLGVAIRLRQFAMDTRLLDDRELYLTTALALEARAERLANALTYEHFDHPIEVRRIDFIL